MFLKEKGINYKKFTHMEQFIVIITCLDKETVGSNAVLFSSFEEAFAYAQKDASHYKHLASEYVEQIGIYKRHANISMKGKYINKHYRISILGYNKEHIIDTYSSFDYLPNDMMI